MMRIDKLISHCGFGSRKEVKAILKQGLVLIDGDVVTDPGARINPETSQVYVGNVLIEYEKYIYLMLNKPHGVISATHDEEEQTVCDLLSEDERYGWLDLFPVGRLDKDTTGLLILTNDGGFAHRALSPKKHVEKVYLAQVDKPLGQKEKRAFETGITLEDGYKTMPAKLEILSETEAEVTIKEGKFHQIKRMFETLGVNVQALSRIAFAGIGLDTSLASGEYRPLNEKEMALIVNLLSKN